MLSSQFVTGNSDSAELGTDAERTVGRFSIKILKTKATPHLCLPHLWTAEPSNPIARLMLCCLLSILSLSSLCHDFKTLQMLAWGIMDCGWKRGRTTEFSVHFTFPMSCRKSANPHACKSPLKSNKFGVIQEEWKCFCIYCVSLHYIGFRLFLIFRITTSARDLPDRSHLQQDYFITWIVVEKGQAQSTCKASFSK